MTYSLSHDGIYLPIQAITHREEEYPELGFEVLRKMQRDHFWYRGRHRFIHEALKRLALPASLRAIDLGGGCGGWIQFLQSKRDARFSELALGDSSIVALTEAKQALGSDAKLYQIDLMKLGWREEWDVAFLLDVLEHIPNDLEALQEIGKALKPGGKLIVTTPAIDAFWSYNDDFSKHIRRYTKARFRTLAAQSGLVLRDARYFMFLLSPLYLLARSKSVSKLTAEERAELVRKQHEIPAKPLNALLTAIFGLETPLGHIVPFPWGTSILGIFEKPAR